MPKIKFTIITLFENALRPYLNTSMMWKAQDKGIAEFDFVNLRDFGLGPHKSVDDTPYGGGNGMLLRCEPVYAAIESVKAAAKLAGEPEPQVILPTPAGVTWTQELARAFAEGRTSIGVSGDLRDQRGARIGSVPVTTGDATGAPETVMSFYPHYIILCPHYEGYDERILDIVDHKISLGRYILTGGELPALIFIDSIVRLIPGVLGGETSALIESFSDDNNIEYPQYTKPAEFRGKKVPEVLLSGDHGKVDTWRKAHEKRV